MSHTFSVTVLPEGKVLEARKGDNLYKLLRSAGLAPEAFCGGHGKCGKCGVTVDGEVKLSCRTAVNGDMCVTVAPKSAVAVLGAKAAASVAQGFSGELSLAFDIGTTTVVCFLSADGRLLASEGELNPQVVYGADVVSRLRAAADGALDELSRLVRQCMCRLTERVCLEAGVQPRDIKTVSVVGNPTMQQLFLGLDIQNLISIPFTPVLTGAESCPAGEYLPVCPEARLLTVPDVSGYVGADTVACVLSTGMFVDDALTLLVDIGTNGEMVLGNRDRMLSCSTAAGPALEGAGILFGMRGAEGAIDRVSFDGETLCCHVIGEGTAKGICGSGLIDAAAVFLTGGRLDRRGHILPVGETVLPLRDGVYLTQDDIRQLQMAKSAVASGIRLLAREYGAELSDIRRVFLAGAFGSFIDPKSACRIGLIPSELEGRISAVGNAAGAGAQMIGASADAFELSGELAARIEPVELAALPGFQRQFAQNMYFTV